MSELVSTIIFQLSKLIIGSNIRSSKLVGAGSICPSKPVFGSSVRASQPFVLLMFVQVKLLVNMLVLEMFTQVNPLLVVLLVQVILLVLATFVQVNPSVLVMFVQLILFALIMSIQVDLSVKVRFVRVNQPVIVIFIINLFFETIFFSLTHHYQLRRNRLHFYFPFQHFQYIMNTVYLR